jgi:putative flippase GtrA
MPIRKLLRRPAPGGGILHWIHSFSLHVLTGVVAVAAHYTVMYGLLKAGVPGVPASGGGFLVGAMARFSLSYWRVFLPTRGVKVASARFVIVIALQLAANSALLAGLIELSVPLWPAQVLTTVLLTVGNYLAYRHWVFR